LCRRIDRQYKQNIPKLATITDGYTNGLCAIDILQRDGKKLQHFATITDGLCAVSILQRVGKKLQHFATITNDYTDGLVLIVILPRVEKKLQPLP
jgi:hypothetical protein